LLSAVDAESSMMIGDSMMSASGKTMPPYAARLISGWGSRATIALSAGWSALISSQLAASGHHARAMCERGSTPCVVEMAVSVRIKSPVVPLG